MKRKKILLKDLENDLKLKCPSCGHINTYNKNNEYKFLYCKKCKYVYGWIENDKFLIYEYNPKEENHIKT
jgi:endogenous inhibitor of DNA gyrase (YacG/DUF329 family)